MAKLNKNLKSLLGSYFLGNGFEEYKRGWLKGKHFDCPFCGRVGKLGVNPSTDFYHCFRCNEKGALIDLVKVIEGVESFNVILGILEKYNEYGYKVATNQFIPELKNVKPTYLPQGFKLLNQGDSQLAKSIRAKVKKRGFDIKEVTRKGWGYCNKGKFFGYLIIPYKYNNLIIYYNARAMVSNGPRYMNPEITNDNDIGKSMILYNREALYLYKSIYLCEGAINAETLSKRAICSGGKYLSQYQINDIIRSPVERVIICLDGDAIKQALDLALKLVEHKLIKVVIFPKDKDINDLGRKNSLKLVYNTRYIKSMNEIIKMKNDYES